MSAPVDLVTERLTQLRAVFDQSFAAEPAPRTEEFEDLLAIRAGDREYALRLGQVCGLFADHPVTPVPGPLPALLGVGSFRGALVPVYDLVATLDNARADAPRWLVLAVGTPPVALAFERLDGHLRVPAEAIISWPAEHNRRGCLSGMVRLPSGARPVVDIPGLRAAVRAMAGHPDPNGRG
jgi:purine-binding chemotaxis protein CheW